MRKSQTATSRQGFGPKSRAPWWETLSEPDPRIAYTLAVEAEMARAQQVGEEAAAQMIAFWAEHRPCPICGRLVADHTRRELRRCDNSRPDLQLVV